MPTVLAMPNARSNHIILILTSIVFLALPPEASAQDRASKIMRKLDRNGDAMIDRDEWPKSPRLFQRKDSNGDGYLTLSELRGGGPARGDGQSRKGGNQNTQGGKKGMGKKSMNAHSGSSNDPNRIPVTELDDVTRGAYLRNLSQRDHEIARGLLESRLIPVYPDNASCRKIDHIFGEPWRGPVAGRRHTGADIPAAWNENILAMADGVIIRRITEEQGGYRGRQLIIRHSPDDTGLPVYLYTLYSHFNKMPPHQVGQRIRMGEVLGPNGKSGVPGEKRQPHLHLGIFYSKSPQYAFTRTLVIPNQGYHADPVTLFRGEMPLDTNAMRELAGDARRVPIAYKLTSGEIIPADAKIIWPFACEKYETNNDSADSILDL